MSDPNVVSFWLYHGGKFIKRPRKRYIDEKLGFCYEFDKNYASFFEIVRIVENFGYVKGNQLLYLLPHRPIQVGIRLLKDDKD